MFLFAFLPPNTAEASGEAGGQALWTAHGVGTELRFAPAVLQSLGIDIMAVEDDLDARPEVLRFANPQPFAMSFRAPARAFAGFTGGRLEHRGGFSLRGGGESLSLHGFVLHPTDDGARLQLIDRLGRVLFIADHAHVEFDAEARRLSLRHLDLRISPTLAELLGTPRFTGLVVGSLALEAEALRAMADGGTLEPLGDECSNPDYDSPVDLALTRISSVQQTAREAGERVMVTPSVTLKNVGIGDIPWYAAFEPPSPPAPPFTDQHPLLVWALYRVTDEGIEQLGQSQVKHAFFSINAGCPCPGGHILWAAGTGCEDTYGVSTNSQSFYLAPRSEIRASTVDWERCNSHWDPDCDGDRESDHSHSGDPFAHGMVISEGDLNAPGASYFLEAWYLTKGDLNIWNSMGHVPVVPELPSGLQWTFGGPFSAADLLSGPVLDSWVDPDTPAPGAYNTKVATADGHVQLAVRTLDLGGGLFRYEYALMNHDYDPNLLALELPTPLTIAGGSFTDIDDDPTNNWTPSSTSAGLRWQGPEGNALSWGTLFAFSFEARAAPVLGTILLSPAPESGGSVVSSALEVDTLVPSAGLFADGFESGDTSRWQ